MQTLSRTKATQAAAHAVARHHQRIADREGRETREGESAYFTASFARSIGNSTARSKGYLDHLRYLHDETLKEPEQIALHAALMQELLHAEPQPDPKKAAALGNACRRLVTCIMQVLKLHAAGQDTTYARAAANEAYAETRDLTQAYSSRRH